MCGCMTKRQWKLNCNSERKFISKAYLRAASSGQGQQLAGWEQKSRLVSSPVLTGTPSHHLVDDDTKFFNLTLDFIALLEEDRRLPKHANTWRRPSQEEVPWVKSDKLGDPGYQIFSLEHHLVGVAALDYLSIHSTADL